MKTQNEITQYIDNKIKSIKAGRAPIQMVNASKSELKAIQKFDSIRSAIMRGFDAAEWCASQLDPDNNEPGSAMYIAATAVLSYVNS